MGSTNWSLRLRSRRHRRPGDVCDEAVAAAVHGTGHDRIISAGRPGAAIALERLLRPTEDQGLMRIKPTTNPVVVRAGTDDGTALGSSGRAHLKIYNEATSDTQACGLRDSHGFPFPGSRPTEAADVSTSLSIDHFTAGRWTHHGPGLVVSCQWSASVGRFPRGLVAGPFRTSPSGANREPWQGQSQLVSAAFQATWQPRCVHRVETACSAPVLSR
jgi:hypothetical protein